MKVKEIKREVRNMERKHYDDETKLVGDDTMTKMKKQNRPTPNGIGPSKEWLLRNGYQELIAVMEQHREKFSHIERREGERAISG